MWIYDLAPRFLSLVSTIPGHTSLHTHETWYHRVQSSVNVMSIKPVLCSWSYVDYLYAAIHFQMQYLCPILLEACTDVPQSSEPCIYSCFCRCIGYIWMNYTNLSELQRFSLQSRLLITNARSTDVHIDILMVILNSVSVCVQPQVPRQFQIITWEVNH